jgi:nucleoid DNA-binding protein
MNNKASLDYMVAVQLGWPVRDVRRVSRAFLEAVGQLLKQQGSVQIARFGTFSVVTRRRGSPKPRLKVGGGQAYQAIDPQAREVLVTFKKSDTLKRLLRSRATLKKESQSGEVRSRRAG